MSGRTGWSCVRRMTATCLDRSGVGLVRSDKEFMKALATLEVQEILIKSF